MIFSRRFVHSIGKVGSPEGNCGCCPLCSVGHYQWALKLSGASCIRKTDVKFAFLGSFIRVTWDLYLAFSCKREFPTKRFWNPASPLASRPCFLQNILAGLETKECSLKESNGKISGKCMSLYTNLHGRIEIIISPVALGHPREALAEGFYAHSFIESLHQPWESHCISIFH